MKDSLNKPAPTILVLVIIAAIAAFTAGCSTFDYVVLSKDGIEAQRRGDYALAEKKFASAVALAEKKGAKNPNYSAALFNLAKVYMAERKYQPAIDALEQALTLRQNLAGATSSTNLEITDMLAQAYQDTRQFGKAEKMSRRSLSLAENKAGANGMDVAICLINLGSLLKDEAKFSQALDAYSRAQSILDKSVEVEPIARASLQNNMAFVYQKMGKQDKAGPLLESTLAILEKTPNCSPYQIAASQNNLAQFYLRKHNFARAETYFKDAVSVPLETSPHNRAAVAQFMENYADMLKQAGRKDEAEAMQQKANAVAH